MLASMQGELLFHPDLEMLVMDAGGDSKKQIRHIEKLLKDGIDLLIVSPNEADPITPIVEKAFKDGIPVIIIDRKINSSLYTAYVGANNYEIGKLAGSYIVNLLGGKGNIMEIWGLRGSTPAIERDRGFREVIDQYPDIKVSHEIDGSWEIDTVRNKLSREFAAAQQPDLVFAHNDVMAYGAYSSLVKDQRQNKTKFVGIDGLPGPGGGIQFVDDDILSATFLYPTGGEEAIQVASRILHRERFQKENELHSTVIDKKNVRVMKLQTDKIITQREDVIRLQSMMNEQLTAYYTQRRFIYILSLSLVIMILIGVAAIVAWRQKKEANLRLEAKTKETIEQRDKIELMAERAAQASQEKLSFFTNISHEFRTPLTLIMGPVEELLAKCEDLKPYLKEDLKLIHKNALRLLLLVNQLMDFRKIEERKMLLKAKELDLVTFLKDVMGSFAKVAKSRKIEFKLDSAFDELRLWFDPDKLDKVIFNLLSNAFKFTHDNGRISVTVSQGDTENTVVIFIEDNGIGMSAEHVARAFDRFNTGENFSGTGLGLSLSKEFIDMHRGSLLLTSERGKGSRFCIILQTGMNHLRAEELASPEVKFNRDVNFERVVEEQALADLSEEDTTIKEHTILIIDDNHEVRSFMRNKLMNDYNIIEAADGPHGLKQAFDAVPDLIICDVMLPGKNGFEVSTTLKADFRTSHIPIIMLTAMDSMEQKITGVKTGVDEYITKPFVFEYLVERIKALIINREMLRDHYNHDLNTEAKLPASGNLDRKFINDFIATIEKHHAKPELTVNEIAHELGMSRIQVYRKAKALMGVSVNDYLVSVRLKKARYLLLNTSKTISEIAFEVGFSSSAYFSTIFKNKFNRSPKDFKANKLS
jgi:signal transduction histidine kinase/DNA-binding response OmpR family regulator